MIPVYITPNHMFSLYEYPLIEKAGCPLYEFQGNQHELNEILLYCEEVDT